MHMNKCILSLRDFKVAVVEEIQRLVQEVKNIQSTLHVSKHIPIPQIPQIHPDEVPEERFQYDEETLIKFKQQRMKSQIQKPSEAEQGESGVLGGKDGDFTMQDSSVRFSGESRVRSAFQTEFEKVEPMDVELEIMKRDEVKHLYMQQFLTDRVRSKAVPS